MNPENPPQLRFFVLTCRDPRNDFRLPLAQALQRDFETWYVWIKRRPVVTGPGVENTPKEMSFSKFLLFMLNTTPDEKLPIYFNSTNALYPGLMLLLRILWKRGIWCFDMHDDLLYHHRGIKRLRTTIAIKILRLTSDVTVHAAATLKKLFPDSHHLGNASQMTSLKRLTSTEGKVLILASVDDRFDFDLVSKVIQRCPNLIFDIYGQVLPFVADQFQRLLQDKTNIHFRGVYTMDELTGILSRYSVTFAPYVTGVRQTEYIDPLRFYHCLNSGMEVITTDIPQAQLMRHAVHVIHGEDDFAELFSETGLVKDLKQPAYEPLTWERRASQLIYILRGLPRYQSLC
jgi:hypothetical protein